MQKSDNIKYLVKPDFVSWDEIHNCLWASHAANREKGVVMKFPSLPGYEIRNRIEKGNGKMFVAMDGDKVVGVAGYQIKKGNFWFGKSDYLYFCFTGVLPEYGGKGIYKKLYVYIERERERLGLPLLVFDTHEMNQRMIDINTHNGFVKVGYRFCGDHYNIVFVKWENGCPYSRCKCEIMYRFSKVKVVIKSFISRKHEDR